MKLKSPDDEYNEMPLVSVPAGAVPLKMSRCAAPTVVPRAAVPPSNALPEVSRRNLSLPLVLAVSMFAPVADRASVPALVTDGVVTEVVADAVVNAPVVGVVAPTVPLMLIDAVPVRLVTVPLEGVPNAPPFTTKAPADPVFTPSAVTTPVPVVIVEGATPAPPPITSAFAASAAELASALVEEKYSTPPEVPEERPVPPEETANGVPKPREAM